MHRLRTAANLSSALFVLCWIGLLVQKIYICTVTQQTWHFSVATECHLGDSVVILELCSKCQLICSDFWNRRLTTFYGSRFRLRHSPRCITFATPMECHFTSTTAEIDLDSFLCQYLDVRRQHRPCSLPYRTYLPPRRRYSWNRGEHVSEQFWPTEDSQIWMQAAVSLIVCNLLVSITFLYCVTHKGQDIETYAVYDYQTEELPSTGISCDGPITSNDLRNISTDSSIIYECHSRENVHHEFSSDKA